MKIYVMEGCPGCASVREKIKTLNVENKFTYVDVHGDYDGFVPENVPVLQDKSVGTIVGESIVDFLDKVYGE